MTLVLDLAVRSGAMASEPYSSFVVAGEELPEILIVEADQEEYVSTILEAEFASSSFGGDYVPPELVSDSEGSPGVSFEAAQEAPFEKGVEYLRARCQTRSSDKTSRQRAHGDGAALASCVLSRISTTQAGWCSLANLVPNKAGGYPQVSWEGFNKFATLGEVVLWSDGRCKPPTAVGEEGTEVSHLCHQPRCMVPSHLIIEGKMANGARKGCVPWIACSSTCRCRGKCVILLCSHEPPCVMHHERYTSQKDLLDNGICRDAREETKGRLLRRKTDSVKGLRSK